MPRHKKTVPSVTVNIHFKDLPFWRTPSPDPSISIGAVWGSSVNIQQKTAPPNGGGDVDVGGLERAVEELVRLRHAVMHQATDVPEAQRALLVRELGELLPPPGESAADRMVRGSRAETLRKTLETIRSVAELVVVAWPLISQLWK